VSAPPIITNCAGNPCVLPNATQSAAYGGFQFNQSGGTAPCTFSIVSGSLSNGTLSLNSSGLVSGTPTATGTSSFSVQVACANGTSPSYPATITVAGSGTTCGPPTYSCSPYNAFPTFAPAAAPFSGLGTAGAGIDNTLVSDPEPGNGSTAFHNPIVRVTNSFSDCGVINLPACPMFQNTTFLHSSQSEDELAWATDSTYFYYNDNGNHVLFAAFNPSTMQSTLLCSSYLSSSGPSPSIMGLNSNPSFSRVTNNLIYGWSNATNTAKGTILTSWTLSNTPCTGSSGAPQPHAIQDVSFGGKLFPTTFTFSTDPPNISNGDVYFGTGWSTSNTQNTGTIAASYHLVIHGCGPSCNSPAGIAWNTANSTYTTCFGNICSTNPVTCQNCGAGITDPGHFTIHNVKQSYSPGGIGPPTPFLIVDVAGGSCSTTCYNGVSPYALDVTTGNVWVLCNNSVSVGGTGNCSGHWTAGYSSWVNGPEVIQLAWRLLSNLGTGSTATRFPATVPCTVILGTAWDSHQGWENNTGTVDDAGIISTTSRDTGPPNYASCIENQIMMYFPPSSVTVPAGTIIPFARTYVSQTSCAQIQTATTSISQDGRFALFGSNMLADGISNGLGCMNGGANSTCAVAIKTPSCAVGNNMNRGDMFIVKLQ
jgi:hypothetical protein